MHLDRETLDRFATGELGPDARAAAEAHAATCPPCRERIDDATLFDRLSVLDVAPPDVRPEVLIARAERPGAHGFGRWAAGIALTFGTAGALYAAPGSPIPGWIASLTAPVEEAGASASEAPPEADDLAGVVVAPGDRLVIELSEQRSGTLGIVLVGADEVTVEATDAAATFDSQLERLVVRTRGSPDYRIAIPYNARSVAVLVGGRRVFEVSDGEVLTDMASVDGARYEVSFQELR